MAATIFGINVSQEDLHGICGINVSQADSHGICGINVSQLTGTVTIKAQDVDGNAIAGVSINVKDTEDIDVTAITNSDGLVFMEILGVEPIAVITATKVGFQKVVHQWEVLHKIDWDWTLNKIVPIIILKGGGTAVNLNPNNPSGNVFS